MSTPRVAADASLGERDDRALISIFAGYTAAATLWLLFATAVGVLLAYKFGAPDFGRGAWLTFGRLRPIHTNATFYGWASLALVGTAYYVVARSSGKPAPKVTKNATVTAMANRGLRFIPEPFRRPAGGACGAAS